MMAGAISPATNQEDHHETPKQIDGSQSRDGTIKLIYNQIYGN